MSDSAVQSSIDPRVRDIEPRFQKLISQIAQAFGQLAQAKGRRATHSFGTVAQGTLTVLDNLELPPHRVFSAGKRYPVLLRHANIKGFRDDAILDGRGATLRLLKAPACAPLSNADLNDPLLDVLMSTGRCFILNNAASFGLWVAGSMEARAGLLRTFPKIKPIFEEIIRDPSSYTQLHYYSETTYLFTAINKKQYFLRYRLLNSDRSADTGFIPASEVRLPLDYLPRRAADTRPETYLQDDFKQRVQGGGVKYLLQLQLQPVTGDPARDEAAKDCTLVWDETQYPYRDVAELHLDSIVPAEVAEPLEFNPYNAPGELALILAQRITETASINHLRSIVYQISADMRKFRLPDARLVDWGTQPLPTLKQQYPYASPPGEAFPRFDPNSPLPPRVQPKLRYAVNFGLHLLPARAFPPAPALGIVGVGELLGANAPQLMPANLTRTRPDKFSDDFFVERRLNGFNPGKLNRVKDKPWQYAVTYDCRPYKVEPGGILPSEIQARFTFMDRDLKVHSIAWTLDGASVTQRPGDSEWEWAKRLFRGAEFVFQEIQSHLGRTHMNIDQYAMAYYRNIVDSPIRLLLEPHLDGLLNINKLGASLIIGNTGFIPEASALDTSEVDKVLRDEIRQLTYRWSPRVQALPDSIQNNHFDRAALTYWNVLERYVDGFFQKHEAELRATWPEVEAMSADLVAHSILKPESGSLKIDSIQDLRQLCVYVMYISSFFHSWVNNKQYEDGGDVGYATIGLWDSHHPSFDPAAVALKEAKQTTLLWTLSSTRYNPLMEVGPPQLRDLLWQHRADIEPGIALDSIMASINI